jgi:hypothetical protein
VLAAAGGAVIAGHAMTTPIVNEITRRLEPVTQDPFMDGLEAASGEGLGHAGAPAPESRGARGAERRPDA